MGTPQDLNQFLASVEKRAYTMALMSVRNPDDALDIVQDVMFTLARKYARKPSSEWTPLFYRILRNRITDFHRAHTVRGRLFTWFKPKDQQAHDPIEDIAAPSLENPEQALALNGAAQQLYQAVMSLPERQQQAFMFRAWEGMNVQDTAKAMGCSNGSVKTHYSRAVHALRDQLEAHYDA